MKGNDLVIRILEIQHGGQLSRAEMRYPRRMLSRKMRLLTTIAGKQNKPINGQNLFSKPTIQALHHSTVFAHVFKTGLLFSFVPRCIFI